MAKTLMVAGLPEGMKVVMLSTGDDLCPVCSGKASAYAVLGYSGYLSACGEHLVDVVVDSLAEGGLEKEE